MSTVATFRAWTVRISLQQSQDDLRLLAALGPTRQLLAAPLNTAARKQVAEQFRIYKEILEYSAIYLLDTKGGILLSDAASPSWTNALGNSAFRQVFRTACTSGQYMADVIPVPNQGLTMAFAMPVFAAGSNTDPPPNTELPIGVVAILSPFSRELDPLLVAQSESTRSAESLFLLLNGNGAQYVSSRRFNGQPVVPQTDTLLRASRSVSENAVTFGQFQDYRGTDVFAAMRKTREVPGIVVSKIDRREALSGYYSMATLEFISGGGILLLYAGVILLHQRRAAAREIEQNLARQKRENQTLEAVVDERTRQLAATNRQLVAELAERQRAEAQVRELNANLEERVRDRTRKLEAANKELEAFSYSVSHDLRAPLRIVDGFTKILLRDYPGKVLDETAAGFMNRVHDAAVRMGRLIEDLLMLSRLSRQDLNRQPVNLSEIADEILAELQTREPARRVAIEVQRGVVAEADPHLARLALENMLGNAWKYTGKTERASIAFGMTEDSAEPAFFIRDNGAGFDMAHASHLFAPFQRLHSNAEFEGNGIGLATVERIVRRHGGHIWAEGRPTQGAVFFFTLGTGSCERRQSAAASDC